MRIINQETFLKVVKEKLPHYDYSKSIYTNSLNPVLVICPIHGVFHKLSTWLARGAGCKQCANISAGNKLRFNLDIFIEKAQKRHGVLYDYSKVVYTGSKNKIEVVCRKHGSFYITPSAHLGGTKCNKCYNRSCFTKTKWRTECFIDNPLVIQEFQNLKNKSLRKV